MWVCAGGGCPVVVWVCAGDGCGFVPVVGLGCGFVWFGLILIFLHINNYT